jgi:hypothetical protein
MRMSLTWWNFAVWVCWFIGLGFVVPESLAAFGHRVGIHVPWTTFSRFFWDLQVRWTAVTLGGIFVLAILASHLIRYASVAEGDRIPVREQVRRDRRAARVSHAVRTLDRERAAIEGRAV